MQHKQVDSGDSRRAFLKMTDLTRLLDFLLDTLPEAGRCIPSSPFLSHCATHCRHCVLGIKQKWRRSEKVRKSINIKKRHQTSKQTSRNHRVPGRLAIWSLEVTHKQCSLEPRCHVSADRFAGFLFIWPRLVALLTRIFTDADEDGSGWLTVHEFVEAVQQPRVVASLEESFGCNQLHLKRIYIRYRSLYDEINLPLGNVIGEWGWHFELLLPWSVQLDSL